MFYPRGVLSSALLVAFWLFGGTVYVDCSNVRDISGRLFIFYSHGVEALTLGSLEYDAVSIIIAL